MIIHSLISFALVTVLVYLWCRHVGDLGNVQEVDRAVSTTLTDSVISLNSTSNNYIIGRVVVVSALLFLQIKSR